MDQYVMKQWLEQWRQCLELPNDDIPKSLSEDIVEPFRRGDPVFSGNAAREMVVSPFADQISRILSVAAHSQKRIMMCEIIFNVCKCTTPECRLFVASQLPLLLWMEWSLDRQDGSIEADISAVEVALLAAFQQDLNIESAVPEIRVPDLQQSSIYHLADKAAAEPRFPWATGRDSLIKPDPLMYPTRPITKIDEYSRPIVYFRLCRFLQDNLPSLPVMTKICYCVLIERMATGGTRMASADAADCLRKLAVKFPMCHESPSVSSLTSFEPAEPIEPAEALPEGFNVEVIDVAWLADLFYSDHGREFASRRFPASRPLYLLWADAIVALSPQIPKLSTIVKRQLLRRARYETLPLVMIALA